MQRFSPVITIPRDLHTGCVSDAHSVRSCLRQYEFTPPDTSVHPFPTVGLEVYHDQTNEDAEAPEATGAGPTVKKNAAVAPATIVAPAWSYELDFMVTVLSVYTLLLCCFFWWKIGNVKERRSLLSPRPNLPTTAFDNLSVFVHGPTKVRDFCSEMHVDDTSL